jgi:hypothetical protein
LIVLLGISDDSPPESTMSVKSTHLARVMFYSMHDRAECSTNVGFVPEPCPETPGFSLLARIGYQPENLPINTLRPDAFEFRSRLLTESRRCYKIWDISHTFAARLRLAATAWVRVQKAGTPTIESTTDYPLRSAGQLWQPWGILFALSRNDKQADLGRRRKRC